MGTYRLSDKPIYSTFAEGDPNTSPEDARRMQDAVDMKNRWRSFRERSGQQGGVGSAFNPNSLGMAIVGANDAQLGGTDAVENKSVEMAGNGQIDGLPGSRNAGGGYGGSYNNDMSTGLSQVGLGGSTYWQNQANQVRGPQAYENQDLSNRESAAKYGDQAGAIQLAREAAMGQAPSEAAYQMQHGLDRSLAAQQAQMGSARGNAGIALASSGAAANSAAMMNQTYTQAGALRAQEMAQARGLYGGLSGDAREQDLKRLGMGNDMAKFNADNNDRYKLGAGQLGLGYYQGTAGVNDADGRLGLGYASLEQQRQAGNADRKLKADTFNAGQKTDMINGIVRGTGTLFGAAMNAYTGGAGAAVGAAAQGARGIGGTNPNAGGQTTYNPGTPSGYGQVGMSTPDSSDLYGQGGYYQRPGDSYGMGSRF